MSKRGVILISMSGGAVWAVALIFLARTWRNIPDMTLVQALSFGLAPGGLVLLIMIGRLAGRRFFNDDIIDGQEFAENSAAQIDQRVLSNTVEQLVLAVCLWPFIGGVLGEGVIVILGLSFGVTRPLFWIGYHISPPLRGFGFAAGFYPTVLAAFLAVLIVAF